MFDRLIAFGCSWTSGRGIIKPVSQDYPHLAWPMHLAGILEADCLNLGKGGSSAKRVWKTALDFKDYRKTDLVIFLWPYIHRSCFFTEKKIMDIRPDVTAKYSLAYYKFLYNETDSKIDWSLRVDHINDFLKDKVFRILNFSNIGTQEDFCKAKILQSMNDVVDEYGTNDEGHPNELGHREIANRMKAFI